MDDTGLEVGERWFFKAFYAVFGQKPYEIRSFLARFMTAHPLPIQALKGKTKGKLWRLEEHTLDVSVSESHLTATASYRREYR